MKLSEFKKFASTIQQLDFQLPNGVSIPQHFHVTEVGYITKNFIDCGGTIREEKVVNFQLWSSNDYDHKLEVKKLLDIVALSEEKLGIGDFEIEVEYQSDTIGKYGLDFDGKAFLLTTKMTDCLAPDKCGIPTDKPKISLSKLSSTAGTCSPGGGCC